jgi:predicted small secreted protein
VRCRRGLVLVLLAAVTLLAACQASGSAGGGASDNAGHGRVKLGLPF